MVSKKSILIEELNRLYKLLDEKKEGFTEIDIYWKPDSESWSIMQILGHVSEFPTFFTNELKKVVFDSASSWGRTMQYEGRLKAVEEANNIQLETVYERIRQSNAFVIKTLNEINDKDLDIKSLHINPKFGIKSMEWLVDHFIVDHLKKHLNQIDRTQNQFIEKMRQG